MVTSSPLGLLDTVTTLSAAGLSAASVFIYSSSRLFTSKPVSALFPLTSTVIGIALFHCMSIYAGVVVLALFVPVFFCTKKEAWLRLVHATGCALCAIAMLWVEGFQLIEKQTLLKNGTHTLQGLVIDKKRWLRGKNSYALTISLSYVDNTKTAGTFKIFSYLPTPLEVGDCARFYKIKSSIDTQGEKLLSYALREHQVGISFTPYIKAKKLDIKTWYSSWISYWHTWREKLYLKLEAILSPQTFTYFSALFLGNKNREDFLDLRAQFSRWGLTHYLARSGLHISLLVSLWAGLLRLVPSPLALKGLLLCIVLFVYDRLSWASISFNRALWLWFFYLGGWLSNNAATPLFGFANIALAILLFNPWQAGCLDFQLSFFLTLVLMLYGYYKPHLFILSSCFTKKK